MMGIADELTSVDDILAVEIVYRAQHLFNGLRRILLCKFALLADTVEQLASGRQFRNDIVFVLLQY